MWNYPSLSTAFQRVKDNHGCAGVDGVTIEKFESDLNRNLLLLADEVKSKTYFPIPLLKFLVDKGKGDGEARALQAAVLEMIGPVLEKEFEDCSFAYRKGRSVRQAVYKIKSYYNDGYLWVIDADIDAYFDSVDHELLLGKVKRYINNTDIVRLIELWIKAEIWDGESLEILEKGIPQGSPISPILANLFLDELDEEMIQQGYKYVRFADDFLILCKTSEKAKESLEFTNEILDKMSLELDEADIVSFDDGFKYLGVLFVRSLIMTPFDKPKKEKKVLYYPPPMNMSAYLLKKKKRW